MNLALAVAILAGVNTRLTVDWEARIILRAAEEYSLTEEEARLLCAIRRVENGGGDIEFGVGSDIPGHPARRNADIPEASVLLQAQWAAGTIARRYRGATLQEFAERWCPPNAANWQRLIEGKMRKQA